MPVPVPVAVAGEIPVVAGAVDQPTRAPHARVGLSRQAHLVEVAPGVVREHAHRGVEQRQVRVVDVVARLVDEHAHGEVRRGALDVPAAAVGVVAVFIHQNRNTEKRRPGAQQVGPGIDVVPAQVDERGHRNRRSARRPLCCSRPR